MVYSAKKRARMVNDNGRVVVLLHGFAAHRLVMRRLATSFERAGYSTLNWGYASWFRSIEQHAERLAEDLARLDEDHDVRRIDFVTHSMGCIVTRSALLKHRPRKQGRWVMLAPPNRGSHAADCFAALVGWVMRPVVELQSSGDSYVNQLEVPTGIDIAIVQAELDYIVSAPLTHIREEKDRFVVPGLHSQMLMRRDVADQSLHFLEYGCFAPSLEACGARVSS